MKPTLFLTGASGAVGLPLLAELVRRGCFDRIVVPLRGDPTERQRSLHAALAAEGAGFERVEVRAADLADPAVSFTGWPVPDVIVHAAASTQFRASAADLEAINVAGTARLLRWAESLPRAPRFIHFSTLCVAGGRTGLVPEQPIAAAPDFINAYEHSKWLAERLVLSSPLGAEIVRLGLVAGRESDGRSGRPGALHAALRWMRRGLLPLIPGEPSTGLELISTDLVARFVHRLLDLPAVPQRVCQLSAGPDRATVAELLALAQSVFARHDPAWRQGQILPPVVASRPAFAAFRRAVEQSRDLLFNQILASAEGFLPVLLYPKEFETARAMAVWGGPLPWPEARVFAEKVIAATVPTDSTRHEEAA